MYSLMSMRTIACSSSKRNSASALAELGLADAGRPEEEERADRAVGVLRARRGARRTAFGDGRDGLVLADHALRERAPPCCSSFSRSPSSSLRPGMPVQRATTSAMSSLVDLLLEQRSRPPAARRAAFGRERLLERRAARRT
jgi:hypothetical protein